HPAIARAARGRRRLSPARARRPPPARALAACLRRALRLVQTRDRGRPDVNARIALLATALVSLAVPVASGRADSTGQLPLRLVADVPLPGGSSRFDYQSLDASRNRLYISHLAAGAAVVFDVKRRRVSATIAGLPGVHGVLVAPSIRRVFAAATDAHELVALDERTAAVVRRIPAGSYPDGIACDPVEQEVFVSDESGAAVIVAEARSGRRLGARTP